MTSIFGVLNKKGMAIAADSAVTISTDGKRLAEKKVVNSGDKMIRLSDKQPVAVMTCGDALFSKMIPWDVLLRKYRQMEGNEHDLNTVEDYFNDFVSFLHKNSFFISELKTMDFERYFMEMMLDGIIKYVPKVSDPTKINIPILSRNLDMCLRRCQRNMDGSGTSPEFLDYSFEDFMEYNGSILELQIREAFSRVSYPYEIVNKFRNQIARLVYTLIKCELGRSEGTDLIFAGYGKEQDNPILMNVSVEGIFAGRLRYTVQDIATVDDEHQAAVKVYAQSDVIGTMLKGMDFTIAKKISHRIPLTLRKIVSEVIDDVRPKVSKDIIDKLEDIDVYQYAKRYQEDIEEKRKQYQSEKWLNVIKDYTVEEMEVLAHNMISATAIHRKLFHQDEGVGGEVDVAIITKEGGFQWRNRKNWYDTNGKAEYGKMGV